MKKLLILFFIVLPIISFASYNGIENLISGEEVLNKKQKKYEITSPDGRKVILESATVPTEQELENIFDIVGHNATLDEKAIKFIQAAKAQGYDKKEIAQFNRLLIINLA